MELYIRQGCPYCAKVLEKAKELDINLILHDIAEDSVAKELIARGGKQQVPYLVDSAKNVEMYESDDIISYLSGDAA